MVTCVPALPFFPRGLNPRIIVVMAPSGKKIIVIQYLIVSRRLVIYIQLSSYAWLYFHLFFLDGGIQVEQFGPVVLHL